MMYRIFAPFLTKGAKPHRFQRKGSSASRRISLRQFRPEIDSEEKIQSILSTNTKFRQDQQDMQDGFSFSSGKGENAMPSATTVGGYS